MMLKITGINILFPDRPLVYHTAPHILLFAYVLNHKQIICVPVSGLVSFHFEVKETDKRNNG